MDVCGGSRCAPRSSIAFLKSVCQAVSCIRLAALDVLTDCALVVLGVCTWLQGAAGCGGSRCLTVERRCGGSCAAGRRRLTNRGGTRDGISVGSCTARALFWKGLYTVGGAPEPPVPVSTVYSFVLTVAPVCTPLCIGGTRMHRGWSASVAAAEAPAADAAANSSRVAAAGRLAARD